MESILTSIKKMLGIPKEYEHFDEDIIMHINSVFMVLQQIGVGPSSGFYIEDDTKTWADFLGDPTQLQMVKTYMHHKVKLIFDPPASSVVMEAMKQIIAECEWRLREAAEFEDAIGTSNEHAKDYILLKDRKDGGKYAVYVNDGDLRMSKKEG